MTHVQLKGRESLRGHLISQHRLVDILLQNRGFIRVDRIGRCVDTRNGVDRLRGLCLHRGIELNAIQHGVHNGRAIPLHRSGEIRCKFWPGAWAIHAGEYIPCNGCHEMKPQSRKCVLQ